MPIVKWGVIMKKKIILAVAILPFLFFFIFLRHQHIADMQSEISALENRIADLEDQQSEISALKDRIGDLEDQQRFR
jgi:cell division protein FtsL